MKRNCNGLIKVALAPSLPLAIAEEEIIFFNDVLTFEQVLFKSYKQQSAVSILFDSQLTYLLKI